SAPQKSLYKPRFSIYNKRIESKGHFALIYDSNDSGQSDHTFEFRTLRVLSAFARRKILLYGAELY
ncbi:MAG: hypothetical protein ACLSGV_10520, partial [Eubacterium sp.]